jgi:hypothetical protein
MIIVNGLKIFVLLNESRQSPGPSGHGERRKAMNELSLNSSSNNMFRAWGNTFAAWEQ